MSNPRTWNRREFSVTPAGMFTVLRSNGWFSALRLPGGFRYLIRPPRPAPVEKMAPDHAGRQEVTLQVLNRDVLDHHPIQWLLAVLAAAGITWALLWWMLFRPHPVW